MTFAQVFQFRDHIYNKSSASINVKKDETGSVAVSVEKKSVSSKQKVLYGSFVKSSETAEE